MKNKDIFFMYAIIALIVSSCASPLESQSNNSCLYGKVVFTKSNSEDIFVVNLADGTEARLESSFGQIMTPRWSPDGQFIVYSLFQGKTSEIYRVQSDGINPVRLSQDNFINLKPVWSSDGENIVYVSYINNLSQIIVMQSDGSHVVQLTNHNSNSDYPFWSPNGQEIVFVSDRDKDEDVGQPALYIMNKDGTGIHRLTANAIGFSPAWSPNGDFIAYVSDIMSIRRNLQRIVLYNLSVGESALLISGDTGSTQEAGYSFYNPVWSQDGRCLMFIRDDGQPKIFVANIDTNELIEVPKINDVIFFDWSTN